MKFEDIKEGQYYVSYAGEDLSPGTIGKKGFCSVMPHYKKFEKLDTGSWAEYVKFRVATVEEIMWYMACEKKR